MNEVGFGSLIEFSSKLFEVTIQIHLSYGISIFTDILAILCRRIITYIKIGLLSELVLNWYFRHIFMLFSCPLSEYLSYVMGIPTPTSYVANIYLEEFGTRPTYWQRVRNMVAYPIFVVMAQNGAADLDRRLRRKFGCVLSSIIFGVLTSVSALLFYPCTVLRLLRFAVLLGMSFGGGF